MPWYSPDSTSRPHSSRVVRAASLGAMLAAGVPLWAGCGVVPRSKLDECHQLSQTLRSENGRLKDVTVALRSQNQDLSERAVDDSRRLSAQDEALERLEKSVIAYQAERDTLAAAFNDLKRQVRLSVNPSLDGVESTSMSADSPGLAPILNADSPTTPDPLRAFAELQSGTGWIYDPESRILSTPSETLFEPGTARIRPSADATLSALSESLKGALGVGQAIELVGLPEPTDIEVRRAGLGVQGESVAPSPRTARRYLSASRAAVVRDRFVGQGSLDPERVRMAAPSHLPDPPEQKPGGIQLRLVPTGGP